MIALLLMLVLALAPAPDVTGRWTGTAQVKNQAGGQQEIPVILVLKQEGDQVTGTGGPDDSIQVPLSKGKLDGDRLTLEAEADGSVFTLELKVAGEEITGSVRRRGRDGSEENGKVTLKRGPAKNPYDTASDAAIGKRYFLGHCSQCHGPEGEGGRGINLTVGRYRKGGADQELFATIRRGIPGSEMPGSDFSEKETWQVVAFVRRLARAGAEEKSSGDSEAGRRVYETRGACKQCHMISGTGGALGPDLTEIGLRRSLRFLEQSLLEPDSFVPENYKTVTVVPRSGQEFKGVRLNEDDYSIQLRDLAETIRSVTKASARTVRTEKGSMMPAYGGKLSPKEIQDLVAYLSSLRGKS
jgi:cytochrome c oxidase cbb3-type subunit 3